MTFKRSASLCRTSVFLATFLVFARSLPYPFLQWDDKPNFIDNLHFRSFSAASWQWIWTTHYRGPYQPISWLSVALDYHLWGLSAPGFRLINLLLHAANAALLWQAAWMLLRTRTKTPSLALLGASVTALFFSLHPLRVESVVWITERRDVLSGFFFLWAGVFYITYLRARADHEENRRWYAGTLTAFVLAILSKATAVGFFWVMLALDADAKRLTTLWREKWPFALAALGVAALNIAGFQSGDLSGHAYTLLERLRIFAFGAAFYVDKTLLPLGLGPYYELPSTLTRISATLLGHALAAALITLISWRLRSRWPALWRAWVCYLLILMPVSGLAQNGQQIAADRYSYLACLPLAVLIGGAVCRFPWPTVRWALFTASAAISILAIVTFRQTGFWRNDVSLWTRGVSVDPKSCLARFNLAAAEALAGQTRQAIAAYEEELRVCPQDNEGRLRLAELHSETGNHAGTMAMLQEVLAQDPANATALNNLAAEEARVGNWETAQAILQPLLRAHPEMVEARFNLGIQQAAHGNWRAGAINIRHAIVQRPALANILPEDLRRKLDLSSP